jgi:RNA polymerase sigma-70 factor (ECF subfamily)
MTAKSGAKEDLNTELREAFLKSRNGDQGAYHSFLLKISTPLRSYFRNACSPSDRENAEDLLQETLIAIHTKKHLYDETQPIMPWIYAIARYRLIDGFRRKKARPQTLSTPEDFEKLFATEITPETELATKQGHSIAAHELLSNLSEKQRAIVTLAKIDEVPLAEIAEKYGMTVSAVKVTIHRALKDLRAKLSVR